MRTVAAGPQIGGRHLTPWAIMIAGAVLVIAVTLANSGLEARTGPDSEALPRRRSGGVRCREVAR